MTKLPPEEAAMPYDPEADDLQSATSSALEIKERHEMRLLEIDGVEGVALSKDDDGEEVMVLYLHDRSAAERVPKEIEGIPVRTEITGPIEAY